MSEKKRIYIAGGMSKLPLYNFPAFDAARDKLKAEGWEVISPADLDRERGFDPTDTSKPLPPVDKAFLDEAMRIDIEAILSCDAIYMLKGWQQSTGAKAEHALAKWKHIEVHYEEESICEEAFRIQGGDRQQDYGDPTQNFTDIAGAFNWYLDTKESNGGARSFEARDIAHVMILMKVARNVHKPKRDNWVDAAGYAQCGGKIDKL